MSRRHATESSTVIQRHIELPPGRDQAQPRRSRWRWLWRLFWSLLLIAALGGGGYWYFVLKPKAPAQEARAGRFAGAGPMPVTPATAQKGDLRVTLNALGTVTPLSTVTVRTQISGRLVNVAFQEGQMVKAGDLLAEIDARPYQAALDQAEGQLLRDQALLKNAELDLQRYRTLAKQDSIATQQRDTQEYLVRQYQGIVKTDQGVVDAARVNLGYCRIVAPQGGRIGLRFVDQGNYVQASDANSIAVVTQLQPITVLFTLPEDNVPAVRKRVVAGAKLEVTAYDRSRTTQLAKGWLASMDNQVDTTTGTVKLKAQFDNADEALFPSQFVNVELLVDTLKDQTFIPTAAVQRGAPGTFVYQIKDDSTVAVTKVKLGQVDAERVAVLEGLQVGDKMVQDGADRLRDGAKVMLPGAGAPGGGPRPDGANGGQRPDGARRKKE